MPVEAAIVSIGARALRLFRAQSDWSVVAVFERSLYLRSGAAFVCVGESSIGDGPLSILTTHGAGRDLGTCPGTIVGMLRRAAQLDVMPAGVSIWHPPPWPVAPPPLDRGYIQSVAAAARMAAPPASFLHALVAKSAPPDLVLVHADKGLDALRRVLVTGQPVDADRAAATLLGLGYGLTPSGDDVLSGAVIMLHAIGDHSTAVALAMAIRRHMRTMTSPLSCAFLDAACDGEPSAAVHNAISGLLGGAAAAAVIGPLADVGHTSGYDLLAGILLGGRSRASGRQPER